MSACWIALGGNQGSVAETFRQSLALLDQTPGVSVVCDSRAYTTAPVGTDSGGQFLNAAAELETSRSPLELLGLLQSVETQLGRQRTRRWGPRTLDLDLLFYDQEVLDSDQLTIPHPHLWYRRFVLDPLVAIAPDLLHPQHQITVSQLRERLLVRPLPCALIGGDQDERHALQRELIAAHPQIIWLVNQLDAAWLVFNLEGSSRSAESTIAANARVINLASFPTPPRESIRDVLTAALDAAHVISQTVR